MNTFYANNQKGFTNNPSTGTQNFGGTTPPFGASPANQGDKKNIVLWAVVIVVVLALVVFVQRSRSTPSSTGAEATTTVETTEKIGADIETSPAEVVTGTITGVSQGITKIVVSRHPDLTTDVEVLAGATTLRNFSVVLQERSNITPVLMYVKKNIDTTLSYDDVLKLVVFKDATTNVQ
ncbi:hypothetical protein IPJ70_02720 [Candidatus Campbellbacteria bacterium]|nr:MAG: hypothetical protein IPJ70_02720 [Candidatus Campbellbacteria bacterium]